MSLRTLSINSVFLPIIIFLFFYKKNKGDKLWVIFLYTVFSLAVDYSYDIIWHLIGNEKKANFYVSSFFTIIEFTLFALFLYYNINQRALKNIVLICAGIFFPISIFNLFQKGIEDFDSITASVECILIIFFSILFLYDQIREPELVFIYTSKKFWVIVAFFLYFSSTLFLFLYAAELTKNAKAYYWSINFTFNIIKNLLFAMAFLMKPDNTSNRTFMKNEYNI